MVPMLHLDHRRPITFVVSSVRAVCTVGCARLGCTARVQGGGYQGSPWRPQPVAVAGRKMVAWRDKVRFFAVAEKTRATRLFRKQKLFCVPTPLSDCEDITVLDSSILCPEVVQTVEATPLPFC